jgi:hypothetical protein
MNRLPHRYIEQPEYRSRVLVKGRYVIHIPVDKKGRSCQHGDDKDRQHNGSVEEKSFNFHTLLRILRFHLSPYPLNKLGISMDHEAERQEEPL